MVTVVKIGEHLIGPGFPCLVVAEAGVNHNGRLELAYQLVDAAYEAGADAVKFQTFRSEKVVSPIASKADYQAETTGTEETQLAMVKKLELPYRSFESLFNYCHSKGILFLSTPFDEESVDFLDGLGIAAFKIGSGEVTNLPFLRYLSDKGKPLILSTGMSTLGEVENAVRTIRKYGNPPLVLLHCVSAYPANPGEANLRAMHTLRAAFGVPIGFSDHTLGLTVSFAAAAIGACVIEKHFTLDRNLPGPDHRASLELDELRTLVQGIRTIEASLGDGHKLPTSGETKTAEAARRSLVAAQDIDVGASLTMNMIAIRRPGTGLPPGMAEWIIGRQTKTSIRAGDLISLDMLL